MGRFVVIAAELVPEAEEDDDHLLGEIREKAAIPWVKEILKIGIRHHLKIPSKK
jgi:hypothetical protein